MSMRNPRLAHQCHADGCDSAAAHRAWMIIRIAGAGVLTPIIRAESTIEVCDRHVDKAVRFLMSPANRQQIAVQLLKSGHGIPDFDGTVVAMAPIGATPEVRRAHSG